ncbi:ABC transporter permease [Plantactinospora veratri]|uniref:Transport permease protein n=1 Tax=Plantactinospora veratri TaxID=1436122 RepID=A0ABU7SLJ9_9ACTN
MSAPGLPARLPAVLAVTRARVRVEFLVFIRERISVVFTFFFPVLLLIVIGAIFHGQRLPGDVDLAQYFVAGMIGAGLFGVSFQNVAIAIPIERDIGTLKRLAGTPMPRSAYFLGKMAMVAFVALAQNVLLLGIGSAFFGLRLPDTADRWLTYLWVIVLGIASCTLLGIAASGFVRNGRTAPAVMSPIAIVLQFISGVYFVFATMPTWMQTVAAIFPLKWIAQGMRSVFLPDGYQSQEPAGSWELDRVALVLAAWCVLGFLVAVRTFRWRGRTDD